MESAYLFVADKYFFFKLPSVIIDLCIIHIGGRKSKSVLFSCGAPYLWLSVPALETN